MYPMDLIGRKPFVSWLILMSLVSTAFFWLWQNGIVIDAFNNDKFFVITFIFAWFVLASASVGYLAFNVERTPSMSKDEIKITRRRLTFGWITQAQLLNLGLAGTTYGFIAMLAAAFIGKDFSNSSILVSLIPSVGENWAAALYATAAGITGAIVMFLESYFVDYAIDMRDAE